MQSLPGYILKDAMQEFDSLKEEANIYKLVGPVLLKQDKTEAIMAVDGRLEFIDNDMWAFALLRAMGMCWWLSSKRTEKQIAEIQASSDKKRMEVSAASLWRLARTDGGILQIIQLQSQGEPQPTAWAT
jgi:hypothetical protein